MNWTKNKAVMLPDKKLTALLSTNHQGADTYIVSPFGKVVNAERRFFMVYVRLIREEKGKTTCEELNLGHGCQIGTDIDRITVSADYFNKMAGYRVTQEDFEVIFMQKHNKMLAEIAQRQSAAQAEKKKEIEESNLLKSEMEGKGFIHQIATLWKWRKRNKGVGA